MKRITIITLLLLVLGGGFLYLSFQPTTPSKEVTYVSPAEVEATEANVSEDIPRVTVIAENLEIPWEVLHLPDGEVLVTERPGRVLLLRDGREFVIEGVRHIGEGGLLGAALHPEFAENGLVYLYQTTEGEAGLRNQVVRYILSDTEFIFDSVILDNLPGARYHDGGRIAFGPDGLLYIAVGDATNEPLAQDETTLHGSILRVTAAGDVPEDNPFGNEVYSYGHRNPQGLAWDEAGQLYSTEHGRSGILSGFDEFNRISSGANYGWPVYEGDDIGIGTDGPILHSGSDTTWAPGGLAYLDGVFYFTGLRGETLYAVTLDKNLAIASKGEYFVGEYGRLRTVTVGPDTMLYITTSNRDGRGSLSSQTDDRILRVNPLKL